MDLADLQSLLYEATVERDEGCDGLLRAAIVPGGTLTVDGAVDVYRRGYYVRLTEALGAAYEAVWRVLGDEEFFAACRAFIKTCPSVSYNLSDYAPSFPAFLEQHPSVRDFPFIAELAEFEWLLHKLFHAHEHSHIKREELEAVALGGDARVAIGHAVILLETRYSISEIWKLRKSKEKRCQLPDWGEPENLLACKLDGLVSVKSLEPSHFELVYRLQQGDTLATALACVSEQYPELDEAGVGKLFHDLYEAGVIASVRAAG